MSAGTLLGTRARKVLVAAGPALALYALGGFVLAPVLLRGPMERRVGAILGRPVTLERLRLNPFAMSVTADGFLISDPDGTPLLRWERLYVDRSEERRVGKECRARRSPEHERAKRMS